MNFRRPRVSVIAFAAVLFSLFSLYSYTARDYGTVRGTFTLDIVRDNITLVYGKLSQGGGAVDQGTTNIGNRTSYLDGLALCMGNLPFVDKGDYALGSLVEL